MKVVIVAPMPSSHRHTHGLAGGDDVFDQKKKGTGNDMRQIQKTLQRFNTSWSNRVLRMKSSGMAVCVAHSPWYHGFGRVKGMVEGRMI